MSMTTRQELQATMCLQYQNADRAQKTVLLESFLNATGYSRKHAIALLSRETRPRKVRKEGSGRPSRLASEALEALILIWHVSQHLCGKRLAPIISDYIENLESNHELKLSEAAKLQLNGISAATIDRLLKVERARIPRSLSQTKRGAAIKNSIPIRTFTEWNEVVPGFFEIDTVSHCGTNSGGNFLSTLNITDIATCWTIPVGIIHKGSIDVTGALEQAQTYLPFQILGLDF